MVHDGNRDETTAQQPATDGRPRMFVFWESGSRSVELPSAGTVTVGRATACDVSIDHRSLSRQHFRITVLEGGRALTVEDLGSANGTRADGVALSPGTSMRLVRGAVVEAGAVSFAISFGVAPSSAVAAPSLLSEPMAELQRLVALAASADLPVLVRGETGAGKEVTAESIHRLSRRAAGPFVTLNCAALPEPLLESALFGHERGAFTGAAQSKEGVVEAAHGGTLFLDEIGELSPTAQAKLLRVLERREVTRVGATMPRQVDVRFVAATHRDLEAMVASGAFRQDLFFRLDGFSLVVPPLRERTSEIVDLARTFAASASARSGRPTPELSPEALALLRRHPWPGNVRELRNVVERAVVLARGPRIEVEDVVLKVSPVASVAPPPSSARGAAPPLPGTLRDELVDIERRRILEALERCAGNQTRAAAELGMSRRTFVTRLDAYGIARPRRRD